MRIKTNVMCLGLLTVSVLGLMSCADQNKSSNSSALELKSPVFETTSDKEREPISLSSFDDAAKSTVGLTLKSTDRLVFSEVKKDVTLRTKIVCTEDKAATQSYERDTSLELTNVIPIYELLPIQLLYQADGQSAASTCRLYIIAVNKRGSIHDFGDPVTFQLGVADTTLMLKLQPRMGDLHLAHSLGFSGISVRTAHQIDLPALKGDEHYWLKCETFNIRANNTKTLGQLADLKEVDKSASVDNRDQLCRFFIESGRVIKNLSNYFMLENANVENLVNNVEMSVAFPRFNRDSHSFKLATVTFFNQTNKIYFGRLNTQSVSASVTFPRGRQQVTQDMSLPLKLSVGAGVFAIAAGQSGQVSLGIPLDKICRPGTFTVQIYKQLPLPMLELFSDDPTLQPDLKPEFSIPMLEPSPLAGVFTANYLHSSGSGGWSIGYIGFDTCGNYR